jgi:hypothetical protein
MTEATSFNVKSVDVVADMIIISSPRARAAMEVLRAT